MRLLVGSDPEQYDTDDPGKEERQNHNWQQ